MQTKNTRYNHTTRKREKEMRKPKIIRDAERVARSCFLGIAIPCDKRTVDGGTIRSEKVLKFNRKALRQIGKRKAEKINPRYKGGDDTMIVKVGLPGSADRKAALAAQYAAIMQSGEAVSPFGWEG